MLRGESRNPELAPELLDWRAGASARELGPRRLAMSLRVPPGAIAKAGRLVPGTGRKMIWIHVVRSLAYWLGVREVATPSQWKALSR